MKKSLKRLWQILKIIQILKLYLNVWKGTVYKYNKTVDTVKKKIFL